MRLSPQVVRVEVWQRDRGHYVSGGGQDNLEFDHIIPMALAAICRATYSYSAGLAIVAKAHRCADPQDSWPTRETGLLHGLVTSPWLCPPSLKVSRPIMTDQFLSTGALLDWFRAWPPPSAGATDPTAEGRPSVAPSLMAE